MCVHVPTKELPTATLPKFLKVWIPRAFWGPRTPSQPSIFNLGATKRAASISPSRIPSHSAVWGQAALISECTGLVANLGSARYRSHSRWFSSSCGNSCSLKWPIPHFRCQCPLENCFFMTKMAFIFIRLPVDFLDNTTWNSSLHD